MEKGDWMLIVSGSSRYAPYLKGWQEFKDHLRDHITGQPGWTDVRTGPRREEMQAYCALKKQTDAESAYNNYGESKGILVHLFETSRNSGSYQLLKCNCWQHFPDMAERGGHSPDRSGIEVWCVNQLVGRASAGSTPHHYAVPATSMYPYVMYPQVQAYAPPPVYSLHAPVYSANTSGIPVNLRHGGMLTEARGVFISNLSYAATQSDLLTLLDSVGTPTETKLHKDTRSGHFKGVATAKFSSKEEAQYAVAQLNSKQHMGMTIRVKLDTDATVVGEVEPLIANGSNTY